MTDLAALQLAALEEDKVTPGLLGFTVVALLAAAVWLLLRSMNNRLKRVNFEERPVERDVPGQRASTSGTETDSAATDSTVTSRDSDAENRETTTQGNGAN